MRAGGGTICPELPVLSAESGNWAGPGTVAPSFAQPPRADAQDTLVAVLGRELRIRLSGLDVSRGQGFQQKKTGSAEVPPRVYRTQESFAIDCFRSGCHESRLSVICAMSKSLMLLGDCFELRPTSCFLPHKEK